MELAYNDAQLRIRDIARELAATELAPAASTLDAHEHFPVEHFRRAGELGLLAVNVPQEHGGAGAGVVAISLALQEIGRVCASTAVGLAVTNMVAESIYRFGDEALIRRYVPRIAAGRIPCAAFALSEPGTGSDAAALTTNARRTEDGSWVLNGTKMWATNGSYAGVTLVMARTAPPEEGPRGISAFCVDAGTPGFEPAKPEDKTGLRGSNTAALMLEDCRVPAENLVGGEGIGFRIAMTALDGGRVTIGSTALGIARAALDEASAYVDAAGPRLAGSQSVQHRLADMATAIEAAHMLVMRAAWMKDRAATDGRRFTREAAMAKLNATECCKMVVSEAVGLMGLDGCTRSYDAERFMRDARVTTIFEGTSEIQKLVISREVQRMAGGS